MPMIPVDTAVQLIVGPLIDDTDFKSLKTGVAYNAAGMSVDLIKSSITGTPTKTDLTLTTASTQDWLELGNGMYYVEITAAQNNTEGELQLVGVATNILPFISPKYQVVPVQVYNSLVAGSDALDVQVSGIDADAITATSIQNNALANAKFAGNAITSSTLAASATDAIADAVWDEDATGHQTGGTFGQAIGDPGANTETMYDAVVTDAAGINIAADIVTVDGIVDNILVDTAEIGVAGAGLTNINLPDQTMNITGDITGNLSGSVGSVTGAVGSVTGAVGSVTGAVGSVTGSVGSVAGNVDGSVGSISGVTFPTNFADFSITASTGRVDIASIEGVDATDQIRTLYDYQVLLSGTATGGSTTTLADTTNLTQGDTDYWVGCLLLITSGTADNQCRKIVGFNTTTDTLTVEPAFTQAITTNTYIILPGESRSELRTATQTSIDNIEADTNELQGDWTDAGRLDAILDTVAADVVNVDGIVPAAAGDSMALTAAAVDAIWDETMTAHATADSSAVHLKDILADTNELQTDDYPTTLATLATTAELDKVPKSDGAVSWNATALGAINAQCDTALTDYDAVVPADLNLTVSGNIGIDWANVENPTTAVDLSGTDIQLVDTATAVTNDVNADMVKISTSAAAADNLEASSLTMVTGAVGAGSHTTASIVASDATGEGDSTFNGRLLVFTSGTLKYEAGVILTYTSTTGAMTFDTGTWTAAPSNTDAFVIL